MILIKVSKNHSYLVRDFCHTPRTVRNGFVFSGETIKYFNEYYKIMFP